MVNVSNVIVSGVQILQREDIVLPGDEHETNW